MIKSISKIRTPATATVGAGSMESEAVVGRRLRVVRELYSAPNGCRVFRVSDVHAPHQPEYALKQVSFDSPEGPRAVMHEAGVFSSLRHDCILRHVASWTSDADVAQLDDDARVLGARRSRMLGERDDSTFNHHGDVIEVPTSARTCAVDDVAMLADATRRRHTYLYILMELALATAWDALGFLDDDDEAANESGPVVVTTSHVDDATRWRWTISTARALACIHGDGVNLVHRDVNPWNVFVVDRVAAGMVKATGGGWRFAPSEKDAALGDFGLAHRLPRAGAPSPGQRGYVPLGERLLWGSRGVGGASDLTPSAKSSMFSAPELGSDVGSAGDPEWSGRPTFRGGAGYGAAADVYSWGLTVLCFFCDDGRDARRTVRAVREASAAGQARGELGWGVGGPFVGSVGDGMMLPNRWGGRCPFPGTLRDVVARTLRLDPETRPTAAEIVKTLLGARN